MEIPFGIDRQIYVRHKLLHESVSQSALGKSKKTRTFEILVRNQKTHQMSIRIYDQIPVSRDPGIAVENVDAAGQRLTWQQENCAGSWSLARRRQECSDFRMPSFLQRDSR